ncbi:hypothetical protein AO277_18260 [Pseudomonas amygdali]|nr:hypothetical protein AO277_18260 [Pseudomonas amygdali]
MFTGAMLIGIDLGKHTFHLHGQDKLGREVFRKKCSRAQMMQFFASSQSCVVAMEACAGSHCVARQLAAIGHTAKLISPQFVKWRPVRGRTVLLVSWRQLDTRPS